MGNRPCSELELLFETLSDLLRSTLRRPGQYGRGDSREICCDAKVHADSFDHGRSASSPVVGDGNDRPTQLLSAVMRDTLRIGAIANAVSGDRFACCNSGCTPAPSPVEYSAIITTKDHLRQCEL